MSPDNTYKLYMEGLILGVNTLYMLFCFFKLFPIGCTCIGLISPCLVFSRSQASPDIVALDLVAGFSIGSHNYVTVIVWGGLGMRLLMVAVYTVRSA